MAETIDEQDEQPSTKRPLLLAAGLLAMFIVAVVITGLQLRDNGTSPQQQKQAKPEARPFASTSPFNTPLTDNAALDPMSDVYVASFQRQFKEHFGNVGINTTNYTPPVYMAGADTPTVAVGWNDCQKKDKPDAAFLNQVNAVPIPADAVASSGSDAEMVVWQPSSDTMWDLWKAKKGDDGNWIACWGGKLAHVSTSDGVYPKPYGTTASGLALIAGLIRPGELASGQIDHALSVSVVDVKAKTYIAPANRTDGKSNAEGAIPEGERFRLATSVNVDSLDLSPAGKTIARAIQKYGMIVRDTSGAVNLYAENTLTAKANMNGKTYTDLFSGQAQYQVLQNFPWDKLQAVAPTS